VAGTRRARALTDGPEETGPEPVHVTVDPPAEQAGPEPVPPPPAADHARGRARPSVLQIAVIALMLVAALGLAAAYGLGLGPFAPSTAPPSTKATLIPETTASPPPPASTAGPEATPDGAPASPPPSVGPAATASPSSETERLLLHVPDALRPDCIAVPGPDSVLATATCSADSGQITLTYLLYSSPDDMDAAYDGFVAAAEIERNTGSCGQPETWPAEAEYRLDELVAGRLLCLDVTDQATIYWTDERLSILSLATNTANDRERLWRFWLQDSGPDL
jgi:hypothetical protein